MDKVRVDLGPRSYDVVVGAELLDELGELIGPGGEVVIITDTNVDEIYGDRAEKALVPRAGWRIVVPAGEQTKVLGVVERIVEDLAAARVRRSDLIVTLGGGMVSDLGGFVASVYQRGIPVVHVPTSLIGQVDAAIGGKTGVNLDEGKNLAGTVYQPRFVIADVTILESLPDEEFISGMAEVLKYGFALEPALLDEVEGNWSAISSRDATALQSIVTRCARAKAAIVSADERDDQGRRIILNYGHTLGHALETFDGYEGLRHGEAISIGMMFAASLAGALGILDKESIDRHARLLETAGLPTRGEFDPAQVMHHIEIDKKNEGSQRWVLLEGLAKPVVRDDVEDALVLETLERVRGK